MDSLTGQLFTLPDGGGSVRSIGESFTPSLFSGTGTYIVKLDLPNGIAGFKPELNLVYSTGNPNSILGMGWQLDVLRIDRKGRLNTPSYTTDDDLILCGQPLMKMEEGRLRPAIDPNCTEVLETGKGYLVNDRNGISHELGTDEGSRIVATKGILSWLVKRSTDPFGKEIDYLYFQDGNQVYLEQINYAIYSIRFIYENRHDILEDRRSQFLISTRKRLTAIEIFCPSVQSQPFRSYGFVYDAGSPVSLLKEIHGEGLRAVQSGVEVAAMPVLKFGYSDFRPEKRRLQRIETFRGSPPFAPIGTPGFVLYDLYGTGLPGILKLDSTGGTFWENKGGKFAAPKSLKNLPVSLDLTQGDVFFADLAGTGTADLIKVEDFGVSVYRNLPGKGLQALKDTIAVPQQVRDLDPETQLADLNGNGRTAILTRTSKQWKTWIQDEDGQFIGLPPIDIANDPDEGPIVSLADPHIHLIDTTGDGLLDLVRVRRSSVDVWHGLGNGKFGPRQRMNNAPDLGEGYDPSCVIFGDITGSGITALIYWQYNSLIYSFLQSGGNFSEPVRISHLPVADPSAIAAVDMLGNGTYGLLISYGTETRGGYCFLDLAGGTKPFLLTDIDNGIGLHTQIQYRSSTAYALEAKEAGNPWKGWLPFPVQTVAEISETDITTGRSLKKILRYENGHYDYRKRKFCGFGMVSMTECGDDFVPSITTVSYFHQGPQLTTPKSERDTEEAKMGCLIKAEIMEPHGGPGDKTELLLSETENTWSVKIAEESEGKCILFPVLSKHEIRVFDKDGNVEESTVEQEYDENGNLIKNTDRVRGAEGVIERIRNIDYALSVGQHRIWGLPSEIIERDQSGRLMGHERYYYDGDPFSGLPNGKVEKGFLSRREVLVLTPEILSAAYPDGLPGQMTDPSALSLVRDEVDMGWWAQVVRQKSDILGNIIEIRGPDDSIVSAKFDDNGLFITRVTTTIGTELPLHYDPLSQNIQNIVDPNGRTITYKYDPLCRLIVIIDQGDSEVLPTISYEFKTENTPVIKVRKSRIEHGSARTADLLSYFDGYGRLIHEAVPLEDSHFRVQNRITRGARGMVIECYRAYITDHPYPNLEIRPNECVKNTYDGAGRLIRSENIMGILGETEYSTGKVTVKEFHDFGETNTAAEHGLLPRVTTRFCDGRGKLLSVVEPGDSDVPAKTFYGYDTSGRLETITNAGGHLLCRYFYDLLGRRIRIEHADAGIHCLCYNVSGDILAEQNANGTTIKKYDGSRRILSVQVNGQETETYHYDEGSGENLVGRLAHVTDAVGSETFSYDSWGRIISRTRSVNTVSGMRNYALAFEYDALDQVKTLVLPDGRRFEYVYDNQELLTSVKGIIDKITYEAGGDILSLAWFNGINMSRTLNPVTGYLESLAYTRSDKSTVGAIELTRDLRGNLLTSHSVGFGPELTRQCSYDPALRLTEVQGMLGDQNFKHEYSYDVNGNLTVFGEGSLQPGSISELNNRLPEIHELQGEPFQLEYDDCGNITCLPGIKLMFDARGRLSQANLHAGGSVIYRYGYDGHRVYHSVTGNDGTVREEVNIGDVFVDKIGSKSRGYLIYRGVRLAVEDDKANLFSIHGDQLGSMSFITDRDGKMITSAQYHAFGNKASSEGLTEVIPYRFLMNELDDSTGLYYFGARYYHPALGRFISPDALMVWSPDKFLIKPSNLNSYCYALNNPLTLIDLTGNWSFLGVLGWIAGAIVIAAIAITLGPGSAAAVGAYAGATLGAVTTGYYTNWNFDKMGLGFLAGAVVGAYFGDLGYSMAPKIGQTLTQGIMVQGAIVSAGDTLIRSIGSAIGGHFNCVDALEDLGLGIGIAVGAGYLSQNTFAIFKSYDVQTAYWSYLSRPFTTLAWEWTKKSISEDRLADLHYEDQTATPYISNAIRTFMEGQYYKNYENDPDDNLNYLNLMTIPGG